VEVVKPPGETEETEHQDVVVVVVVREPYRQVMEEEVVTDSL
jgi:hypothetical protein